MSEISENRVFLPYNSALLRPRIVHFGMGNFSRAHTAFYIHKFLSRRQEKAGDWGMVGVALRPSEEALARETAFRTHHGGYHLVEAAPDGRLTPQYIGVWTDYLIAPHQPQKLLDYLTAPELKLVTLTITEGGYDLKNPAMQQDMASGPDDVPQTAFGYILAACVLRQAQDLGGFGVWSCDNQQHNGDLTRNAVLFLAENRDPALAEWCAEYLTFPNSMVDRITPKMTGEWEEELGRAVLEQTGEQIVWPVLSEEFHQWVIEARAIPPSLQNLRVMLAEEGVIFSDHVDLYEQVKMRLLNAGHGLLCYTALLMGYCIKDEAMRDESDLRKLLSEFWHQDVRPHLEAPEGLDLGQYCTSLAERFANLAISDQAARVASDGVAKIPAFWGPTIRAILACDGPLERVAFGLAAYIEMRRAVLVGSLPANPQEPGYSPEDIALLAEDNPDLLKKLSAFRAWQDMDHAALDNEITHWRLLIQKKGIRTALALVSGWG